MGLQAAQACVCTTGDSVWARQGAGQPCWEHPHTPDAEPAVLCGLLMNGCPWGVPSLTHGAHREYQEHRAQAPGTTCTRDSETKENLARKAGTWELDDTHTASTTHTVQAEYCPSNLQAGKPTCTAVGCWDAAACALAPETLRTQALLQP
jgi:hypothetical protein